MTDVEANSKQSKNFNPVDQNTETTNENDKIETLVKRFEDLKLNDSLLKGIISHGFTYPTPIQSRALTPCIEGRDVIAQAQSGTGKTGTFVISALQSIDVKTTPPIPQVVAIAPTRELSMQIHSVFESIGQYMGVKCTNLIGGVEVDKNVQDLKSGVHVVAGCPGRVTHMIDRGVLSLEKVKMFIIDEADEMLKKGFIEKVHYMFTRMPKDVQVILVSATMPEEIIKITDEFMRNPVKIIVKKEHLTLDGIKQFFFMAQDDEERKHAIIDILGAITIPQMVIFCNTRRSADTMTSVLKANDFKVAELHSDMLQADRSRIMSGFRDGEPRILVTTDVVARGIDVQAVSLVVNYELPVRSETYIHRIGRAGRYGRTGVAINLLLPSDEHNLREIIETYKTEINELPDDFAKHLPEIDEKTGLPKESQS